MARCVVTAQSQQYRFTPCWCCHSFPMWTGLPKLILCSALHPMVLLLPSQSSALGLFVQPTGQCWESSLRINTYFSLEKGQGKICLYSASLHPWPPCSPWRSRHKWHSVLQRDRAGYYPGSEFPCRHRNIQMQRLQHQRAGSSLSWWMATCHLQITCGRDQKNVTFLTSLLLMGANLASTDWILCI